MDVGFEGWGKLGAWRAGYCRWEGRRCELRWEDWGPSDQDWQSCSLAPFGVWVLAKYFTQNLWKAVIHQNATVFSPSIIGFPIRTILWVSRGICILSQDCCCLASRPVSAGSISVVFLPPVLSFLSPFLPLSRIIGYPPDVVESFPCTFVHHQTGLSNAESDEDPALILKEGWELVEQLLPSYGYSARTCQCCPVHGGF
jgi:hypothetical protein